METSQSQTTNEIKKRVPDFRLKRHQGYLGNAEIKRAGVKLALTRDHISEFIKCRDDIEYFCKTYAKIVHVDKGLINFNPYPFQDEIFRSFKQYRNNAILCSRQLGKCLAAESIFRIRNKRTGEIYECTAKQFHEWQRFRKWCEGILSDMQK